MYTSTITNQTSNKLLMSGDEQVGSIDESVEKSKRDQTVLKRKSSRLFNKSCRTMTKTGNSIQAISMLLLLCSATIYVEAGGKGEKGSEGNIIISTGGGGGSHVEKIKIMKIPVPFPVIKHVPYPVPVPIIQKKYIPVEKYIPVYKHHHGSSSEGSYGGEESQQHDQYGSSAQISDQENTASNQVSGGSSYGNGPYSAIYKTSARTSGNHYWQPQMYSPQQSMGVEGHLNPYALQMASSNGVDMNNIFSGSPGYSLAHNTGHPEFGQLYNNLAAGSGYVSSQASNPIYQTAYGFAGSNLYGAGAGQIGDSSFQQQYAALNQADAYGSGADTDSALYQQSMSLPQASQISVAPSSSSTSSISSPGSSAPVPRFSSKLSGVAASQNSYSTKQSSSTTSPASSAQTSSTHSNKAFVTPQSSNTIAHSKYSSKSPPSSSSTHLNGFKSTSGSSKLLASSSSPFSTLNSNEMVAVSSTPQAYHQSLMTSPKSPSHEQKLDTSNSRLKPNVVQLPIVQPSMVSVISQQASQQQQVGAKTLPQQASQQQSTFSSSLLSPTQVGDQILQRLKKFTNHLTNSTKTLQQQIGVTTIKL